MIAPEAADAAVPKVSQLSRGLADRLAILNFKVLTGEPTLHLVIYGPIKIYDFGKQWVESSRRRIESRLGKRRFSGRARQRGANHPISLAVHGIQDIRLCWYTIVGKVLELARGIEFPTVAGSALTLASRRGPTTTKESLVGFIPSPRISVRLRGGASMVWSWREELNLQPVVYKTRTRVAQVFDDLGSPFIFLRITQGVVSSTLPPFLSVQSDLSL